MNQAVSVPPGADPGGAAAAGAPRPQLRTILKLALAQAATGPDLEDRTFDSFADHAAVLAPILAAELAAHGYRIHDTRRCVRVPLADEMGRPMTDAEQDALDLSPIPHPRRRP